MSQSVPAGSQSIHWGWSAPVPLDKMGVPRHECISNRNGKEFLLARNAGRKDAKLVKSRTGHRSMPTKVVMSDNSESGSGESGVAI